MALTLIQAFTPLTLTPTLLRESSSGSIALRNELTPATSRGSQLVNTATKTRSHCTHLSFFRPLKKHTARYLGPGLQYGSSLYTIHCFVSCRRTSSSSSSSLLHSRHACYRAISPVSGVTPSHSSDADTTRRRLACRQAGSEYGVRGRTSADGRRPACCQVAMGPAFPTRDEMTGEHLLAKDWDNGDGDVSFPGSLQGQGEAAPGTTPPGRRGGAGAERALAVLQVACVAVALLAHAYAYCAHLKLPWLGAAGTKGLLSLSQLQLSTWQIVPLCAALLIDAVLRIMSWRGGGLAGRERVVESRGERAPPAGQQRMAEMEEHVGTTVRLLRAMSRQMEKLGVRFRVARRTLRDSLKETAGLAGQTAGIVEILAARSERLEKELAGTQQVLLATQLRVFSDALLSSQRSQVALEHRLAALETKRPEGASLHAPSPSPPSSASPPPPVPPPAESAQRAGPAGRVTGWLEFRRMPEDGTFRVDEVRAREKVRLRVR
eukprot:jgi/Mesen1/8063/ME000432S07354